VRYRIKKFLDPSYHLKQSGGDHRSIFSLAQQQLLMTEIVDLKNSPSSDLRAITQHISEATNQRISMATMSKILHKHRWSWKVPTRFQSYSQDEESMVCIMPGMEVLQDILNVFGVHLIFLPYSPELSPYELVFSVLKSHIRLYRKFGTTLLTTYL